MRTQVVDNPSNHLGLQVEVDEEFHALCKIDFGSALGDQHFAKEIKSNLA